MIDNRPKWWLCIFTILPASAPPAAVLHVACAFLLQKQQQRN
jgi:hypothetical protein